MKPKNIILDENQIDVSYFNKSNIMNAMKYSLLLLIQSFISVQILAQPTAYCGSSRYDSEIFSSVHITSDVVFGSNVDYTGATVSLTMDIYEPDSDTAAIRPLIVWVHGGSFLGGTKNDGDVTSLCDHFARRGYVCISINYRLGMASPSQATATQAVFRAVQDMKAAIRFMRKDAATANLYRIDPDFVVGGGSSAGAFTALHLAYLDQPSELPSQIDTTLLGGMEGNSGNPGYRSTVNAVVNLCGALGNKTWLIPGDKPLCSMHGTADNVVPYGTAMLYILNIIPIMIVDGSHSINDYANTIGVPNVMYTFFGQNHVPYASSLQYMDTTVRFVSNFLYYVMGCTPSSTDPLPNTFGTTGITTASVSGSYLHVYPNPASDHAFVELNNDDVLKNIQLYDLSGRKVKEITCGKSKTVTLEKGNLSPGFYILKVSTGKEELLQKISFE